jgi:ubiquinone/menaquinone biosynthesis C-methylase UbiE
VAALARHCERLLAIDKLPQCLRSVQRGHVPANVCLCAGDAHALPLADQCVDHIVAFGLFAYVVDTISVLREFRRVCRRGGWVMITNSVSRSPQKFRDAAAEARLTIVEEHKGYCPAASGSVKRRQLVVYERQS